MQMQAHAAAGWLVAELGNGNRRFRQLVLGAAILPDIDGLSFLFGQAAYIHWHHRITHTLLFIVIYAIIAAILCKGYRIKVVIASVIAFATHIAGDFYMTKFEIYFFWPFSNQDFISSHAIALVHPLNKLAVVIGWGIMIWLSIKKKRTPFEAVSQKFNDRIVRESKEWVEERKAKRLQKNAKDIK